MDGWMDDFFEKNIDYKPYTPNSLLFEPFALNGIWTNYYKIIKLSRFHF